MDANVVKKVLVADRDQQVLELAEAVFRKEGYEVILAQDGRDALRKALSENPDAILLDTVLPAVGQTDICSMLKSNKATQHIPVACLTGPHENKGHQALQGGAALLLLPKPFKPQQLVSSVGLLLSAGPKRPTS